MKKLFVSALTITLLVTGMAVQPVFHKAPAALASPPGSAYRSGEALEHAPLNPDLAFVGGSSITLSVGTTRGLELTGAADNIEWQSSNPRIATVSSTGIVGAHRAGASVVTARNPESGRVAVCTVKVFEKRTQKQVRKAILALRKHYHAGVRWTNDNYYYWQAGNSHCYGCIAFAALASDRAFGKFAPLKRHARLARIKAGDHVRIGKSHSTIVLYKKKKSIIVAEGNYNDTIHWNRRIPFSELKRQGFYVETRYRR